MIHSGKVVHALVFVLLLICDPVLAQLKNDANSPTPVSITVTVTNQHKEIVSGLPQSVFTVSDDKGLLEITSFDNEDAPMSIAILLDSSGSMRSESGRKKIRSIGEALSRFVQQSHPSNEYFLIWFNTTTHLLFEGAVDVNTTLSALHDLASLQLGGNTALYDACSAGIEKLAHGAFPKRVMLLITDGRDNSSQRNFNNVRDSLKERNILVYAVDVSMGWEGRRRADFNVEGAVVLEEFASLTGGRTYSPDTAAETSADLERIALELRRQYSISFRPTRDASRPKWHPLKLRASLSADNLRSMQKVLLRSRKGYWSTPISK